MPVPNSSGVAIRLMKFHLSPKSRIKASRTTVLTSMVKRVDLAVGQAFRGVKPGITSLGLKEGGVGYAVDQHNERLLSPAMRQKTDAARDQISAGQRKVIDYTVANTCR